MGRRHVKVGRPLLEIDLEGFGIPGSKGIALDLLEEIWRGAVDGVQQLTFYTHLRQ